jgi:hypothetical protein
MTWAQLCLDGYHPALFAAHFSHFGLFCFRIDQDCGFMPKIPWEFLNRLAEIWKSRRLFHISAGSPIQLWSRASTLWRCIIGPKDEVLQGASPYQTLEQR